MCQNRAHSLALALLPSTRPSARVFARSHGERNTGRNICRLNSIGARLRERAVLTFRCARTISWSARFSAAAALYVLSLGAVHADGMVVGGCVGSRYSITCVSRWGSYGDPYVRLVHPETAAEKALSAERDRKWQVRCRPAVFQDQ